MIAPSSGARLRIVLLMTAPALLAREDNHLSKSARVARLHHGIDRCDIIGAMKYLPALILAAAACGISLPTLAAQPDSTTGQQMIDAFEGTFGVHAGQRRNHIKGTCAAGEFVGTSDAAALSRSALFSGESIPVIARF